MCAFFAKRFGSFKILRTFAIPFGKTCRSSSVGRAQPCQGWGREFEPRLLLQDKQGHLRMTLNFENTVASAISPDGVQSYVSRPCAQGGFFYGSTENLGCFGSTENLGCFGLNGKSRLFCIFRITGTK